ncbi:biotin synthase BioB [Rickettsia hoogstraalii]|uniref:biotin synthase BioB n=1 Tax=Rickettsia hoogstraalii TaxID=467174 RepID=UPI000590C3BE|nr:biotin synthase BioB [Rickettsia hoogstraalii]
MKKWTFDEAKEIFSLPFMELIYQAQTVHRTNFDPNKVQISSLLSIKTGSCPENCKFCPQSAHYKTDVKKEPSKEAGSTRFCMGAAWRGPRDEDLKLVCEMIKEVKKLGLETCVTLGLLKEHQAVTLKEAGLDFYNHNIDTSEGFYDKIITTRTFQDRLDTLGYVRASGMKVCCGGILGMGETNDDRINMILTLANLEEPAESVTINKLIKIPGTPLENVQDIDLFDFVRVIALARIMIPKSYIRLSAGREQMSDELQALCIMAGVNSISYGEKLLTSANPMPKKDNDLFQKLGITH